MLCAERGERPLRKPRLRLPAVEGNPMNRDLDLQRHEETRKDKKGAIGELG